MSDRYLKVVLTIIALELGWIEVKDTAVPVAAQAQPSVTPVVIRGIDLRDPVVTPVPIQSLEPLSVVTARPVQIDGSVPLRIHADRPIPVENVGYTPGARPGE